jgi:hypothetical protein
MTYKTHKIKGHKMDNVVVTKWDTCYTNSNDIDNYYIFH